MQRQRKQCREYELKEIYLPNSISRKQATALLTGHADYGSWELSRVRLLPDGSRRVWLRRSIIRPVITLDFNEIYDA